PAPRVLRPEGTLCIKEQEASRHPSSGSHHPYYVALGVGKVLVHVLRRSGGRPGTCWDSHFTGNREKQQQLSLGSFTVRDQIRTVPNQASGSTSAPGSKA
ncbi:unnamed protein product, partial [Gulo gulo]